MGELSPFPSDYVRVELLPAGADASTGWLDVTSDLSADGITITRGRSTEGQDIDPSSMTLTLRNTAGRYAPRNPRSDLYGLIGRGTPVRVSVKPEGVSTRQYRFWGEVLAWPQSWGRTGSASAVATLECAGAMRRLGQGASPLRSPWYRACVASYASSLAVLGYWPMEEPSGSSTTSLQPAAGSGPLRIVGAPELGAFDGMKAAAAVPVLGSGGFTAALPTYTSTGKVQVRFLARVPLDTTAGVILARVRMRGTTGRPARADVIYSGGGALLFKVYDDDGNELGAGIFGSYLLDGRPALVSVELKQSGTGVVCGLVLLREGDYAGASTSFTLASSTLSAAASVSLNPELVDLPDVAMGHLIVISQITSIFEFAGALDGHEGEPALARFYRLCDEEDVPASAYDRDSQALGVQRQATFMELLREAARADGGLLYEPRGSATQVHYIPGRWLYNRTPTLDLPYTDNLLLPFEPVDDDTELRNRVTVQRDGGSDFTADRTDGALGTDRVGVYDESVTLSLASDDQCRGQAAWRVHLGTVDEARWPTVGVELAHPTFLASATLRDAVLALSMGLLIRVTDLPSWVPPGPLELLVQGYTETILPTRHRIEFTCTPYAPYRVARWGVSRWAPPAAALTQAMTSSTTTMVAGTGTRGVKWGVSTGPFDVMVDGERMTVLTTGFSQVGVTTELGTTWTGTFQVVRGVNGVTRAHAVGAAVRVVDGLPYPL